ncbi:MAG: SMP-30/gluconolactonase/LRE family protein [Actinomycetota bacterium]
MDESRAMPSIDVRDLGTVGDGLQRPECVLATASGDLFASNWRGGVSRIRPDGTHHQLLATDGSWLRPNGIALRRTGTFLLAHLGDDEGGVFELSPDGGLRPFLTEVDGVPLPPTNFVAEDHAGRVWVTVSTRLRPRAAAYRPDVTDGFVVLVDDRGARIVADGLCYTNEAVVRPDGSWLYVNETFGRRLARFPILDQGELGPASTVTEFGSGTFPDGLVFDEDGGAWVTSIISNRVIRVDPSGSTTTVIEDADPEHLAWVEAAFGSGGLDRPHLDTVVSSRLANISSLCFGGPDRRTGYLGCLLGQSITTFRSPVAGAVPSHWAVRV